MTTTARVQYCDPSRVHETTVSILMQSDLRLAQTVVHVAAHPFEDGRRFHDASHLPTPDVGDDWENELEEVVDVADANADDVHHDWISQHDGEGEHDPWEVGRVELEETEHGHFDIGVPSAPNVDHHEGQCAAQEVHMGVDGDHADARNAKHQHQHVVRCSSPKIPLFQQPAVSDQEVHVEQEIDGEDSKEEVGCYQPPKLTLDDDEIPIEVQIEWADYIHGACSCGEEGTRQVEPRDDWNLHVPSHDINCPTIVETANASVPTDRTCEVHACAVV
mmetsp:Transcript_21107/g.58709  ORF Transcript_21107/g.58709 Transcript_21107/m.58709 type:complete len:276 (-) Transcript_21107:38-865(-)